MGRSRVAAIGIDAAEWSDVEGLIAEGALPHIKELLEASARATLKGDLAYRAEASWTEFLTSRLAGENRYWTTAIFDPKTYETWEIGAHHGVPFYGRPDLKVVAFDIPHSTMSPEANGGAQIIAWGAHSPQAPSTSVPPDLLARIDERFGVHPGAQSDSQIGWHNEEYGRNLTAAMVEGLRMKTEICTWLTTEEVPDWDVFCTVLSETHTTGHQFFHGTHDHPLHSLAEAERASRSWREVWDAVDESVGQLVKALDSEDTTIILFAVHGMRGNGSDVTGLVLLPELLHRQAFGKPLIDYGPFDPAEPPIVLPPQMTPADYILRRLTEPKTSMRPSRAGKAKNWLAWTARRKLSESWSVALDSAWRRAKGAKARANWWEMQVREPGVSADAAALDAPKPLDYLPAAWYCGYWPQMKAFLIPSFSDAHVRVNLRGRERDGIVAPEDYAAVLDEIEATFDAVTDARTGKPVVESFVRMRADDPFAVDGPTGDLVITFREVSDAIHHPDFGVIGPAPLLRSGEHTDMGWAAIRPPDGASGDLGTHRPRDLGPTIIDLLDRPPSPLSTGSSFAGALHHR